MDKSYLWSAFEAQPVMTVAVILLVVACIIEIAGFSGWLFPAKYKETSVKKSDRSDFPNDGSVASAMMFASRDEPSPKLSKELDIDYHDSATDSGGGDGGGD